MKLISKKLVALLVAVIIGTVFIARVTTIHVVMIALTGFSLIIFPAVLAELKNNMCKIIAAIVSLVIGEVIIYLAQLNSFYIGYGVFIGIITVNAFVRENLWYKSKNTQNEQK